MGVEIISTLGEGGPPRGKLKAANLGGYTNETPTLKPGVSRGSSTPPHPWSAMLVKGGTHIPPIV